MPNVDFNCAHCRFFQPLPTNGHQSWMCSRHGKQIERSDPHRCVCRAWRPAPERFPQEVRSYFEEVAPGALLHMRSKELYHIAPDCELMPLS